MSQESLFPTEPILKNKTKLNLKTEADAFSVSEISQKLKQTVEVNFSNIRIRGEVSQPKYHGSGHLYCRLKDENAVIDAVCWRGTVSKLPFKFEDGIEVICRGRLTTYPGRSQYQIVIESAELAGEGALLKMIEMRKQSLMKEGLFDADRKKQIPFLPKIIGIITSPTGAVIEDILHRLQDRFPTQVLLWPVAVQGIGSELQIAEAITGFNDFHKQNLLKPDLLIVARGGGSLEDLMAFNEEVVVRAVAESEIPIISAIGHETDTTLIDFAADLRAPTPTAAAEMAVPVREELTLALQDYHHRMRTNMHRFLVEKRNYIDALSKGIKNPQYILDQMVQKCDDWGERLQLTLSVFLRNSQQKLGYKKQLLESYSYRNVLKRGYAIVKEGDQLIGSASDAKTAKNLSIQFHDGEIQVSKNQDAHSKQADLFD